MALISRLVDQCRWYHNVRRAPGRSVDLTVRRNDTAFASSAVTRNQIATADSIDSIGVAAGHPVHDAIAQLPDDKALIRRSFDQLSGDIRASAKTALIEDSQFVRDAAGDRMRAAFGGVAASSLPVMAFATDGAVLAPVTTERPAFWGQGFGAWGQTNGDNNAAALKRSTGGFLMGADASILDGWRFGVIVGYSRTSFSAKDHASTGSSDNYHAGVYGGTIWQVPGGVLGLRTGLAYTWHDSTTSRSVTFLGFGDRLRGRHDAGTFQTFGELGYRIDTNVAAFEPYANLAHVSLRSDGFAERGGAAALYGAGQTTDTTFTTLGLRASSSVALAGLDLVARGTLGWRHAFGETTPLSTQAFSAGNAFSVAGVPIARNAAVVEAGLDLKLTPQATISLSYEGQLANIANQHGVSANFNVRF
ncbi:hypothetical protein ASE63_12420 [Bosea sp. Root381]|nr:hypothetical protein ASE63_12420 [Bosea sp. Root381]